MTWPQRVVPPDAMEMGALAHGPRVLARAPGIVVGLRSSDPAKWIDLVIVQQCFGLVEQTEREADTRKLDDSAEQQFRIVLDKCCSRTPVARDRLDSGERIERQMRV